MQSGLFVRGSGDRGSRGEGLEAVDALVLLGRVRGALIQELKMNATAAEL